MQLQVDGTERQLSHLSGRPQEGPATLQALEQFVGERLAAPVVTSKQFEGRLLPGPVLHNLARKLDEVPRNVHAAAALDLDSREQMVQ